ncbi:MAG: FliA/WhiG family RNA polymerase sigma factor [Bacteroidetes bacterium]|nr:FliA/WhiG family RNA polymerase sigma factor [Bacteroidota bacterium]
MNLARLQALAEAYSRRRGDETLREAVILAAIPLVRRIVGKITVPAHPLAQQADLESAGIIGLLQALEAYNPQSSAAQFHTFAYQRIRGQIIDYLRQIDALPRGQRQRYGQLQEALEQLRQELGTEPTDQQVADRLGLSLSQYQNLLMEVQRRFVLSLEEPWEDEEEGIGEPLEARLSGGDGAELEEAVDQGLLIERLERWIAELPERERTILALYYYEDLTLKEIAQLMGLTEARISQILGKLLLYLRARLRATISAPQGKP